MTGQEYRDQAAHRHVWRHCLENGVLAVLGSWLAVSYLPVPTRFLVGLVFLGGLISSVASFMTTGDLALGIVMSCWTVELSGWAAYARVAGQRHWITALALLGPVMALVPASAMAWTRYRDQLDADEDEERRRQARAVLLKWDRKFERLGFRGIRTVRVEEVRGGRSVYLKLPESGAVTLAMLANATDHLEVMLRLRPGSVTFESGDHSGHAILHLNESDIMAEAVPFPGFRPGEWLSVSNPLPVGLHGNGDVAVAEFREVQCMVIAMSGSGKSNLLNVLIALFSRCPDALIWVVDLKGGRMAAPWIRPWIDAQGQIRAPAVDWVATTRAEAEIMFDAAIKWMEARMNSLSGGSKVTPSYGEPQLIVIGDEVADLLGLGRVKQAGEKTSNLVMADKAGQLTRKGRSEAMTGIWTTQRGTVTMTGGGDLKSQCKLRFALGVASEADAATIIPDDYHSAKLLAAMAVNPGAGLVWRPGRKRPQPVKFYRLDSAIAEDLEKITMLAAEAGEHRPGPEQLGLDVMGEAYSGRWKRSDLAERLRPQVPQPAPVDQRPATTGRTAVIDRAADAATFADIVGHPDNADLAGRAAEPGMTPARLRMYALLAERPATGMSAAEIALRLRNEGHSTQRETASRWLSDDLAAGRVEKMGSGNYRLPGQGR